MLMAGSTIEDNGGQYYFFEVRGEEVPQEELKTKEFIPFQEQDALKELEIQTQSKLKNVFKKCECGTVLKEGWIVCPVCGKNIV